MNRLPLIKIEDDIDDDVDVGNVDFPIAIDVGHLAYRVVPDVFKDDVDISNIDLAVTIDVPLDSLRFDDVGIMGIEVFQCQNVVSNFTALVQGELDGLDSDGKSSQIVSPAQCIQIEDDVIFLARLKHFTVDGVDPKEIGCRVIAIARINLYIVDGHSGEKINCHFVGQAI